MSGKKRTLDKDNGKLKLNKIAKKQNFQERGITLIALVVTIIILLILAGVTLNIALSDNGLFNKAKEAAEKYQKSQEDEEDLINEISRIRKISTTEDLKQFAKEVNEGNTFEGWTISLMSDIDLSTVCGEEKGSWNPIGVSDHPFKGNFDGNNKTISNLWISQVNIEAIGFFGYVRGGELKNLTIEGKISFDDSCTIGAGGLVGSVISAKVENVKCNVNIDMNNNSGDVGGLAGWASYCTIIDVSNLGNITTGGCPTGGIIGNCANMVLERCSNSGNISGKWSTRRNNR